MEILKERLSKYNMFKEIEKKNKKALNVIEDGDSASLKALRNEVDALLREFDRLIVVRKDKVLSEAIELLHSEKKELTDKLGDKYVDLAKQMQDDYQTEMLLVNKMYMQQELKMIKKDDRKVENYIPKLTRDYA